MTTIPSAFPTTGQVFDANRETRFLALAIETVVHDMSPVGDEEVAEQITDYLFGESSPPEEIPEYVEIKRGNLLLSNPPFLIAETRISKTDEYLLETGFDSDLQLLIDPPVWVTVRGPFGKVVETFEQILAEIYRTKGRRLEMIDNSVIDPDTFAAQENSVTVAWTVENSSCFSFVDQTGGAKRSS